MIERAVYRTKQFLGAMVAPLARKDLSELDGVLTPEQQALFLRMRSADQRHALAVYSALKALDSPPLDLLVAALLHDVGKVAARFPLWMRAVVILLGRLSPALLQWLNGGQARGWRRPFVIYRQHAEIGAQWARQAGCTPQTVDLISRHQQRVDTPLNEQDRLLLLLQEADGSF